MIKEAIILAGGFGTRLKGLAKAIPKPMVDINGEPFLKHLLDYITKQGINKIVLSVGYRYEVIRNYFGKSFSDAELIYSIEDEPLGTGGAVKKSMNFIVNKDILVCNGDTFFKIDLHEFNKFHINKKSKLSVALKIIKQPDRYGVVEINKEQCIKSFLEKKQKKESLVNGGIYLINKNFFTSFDLPQKFSLERDFLKKYYLNYKFYGFISDAYFIDIGIPEDYEKAKNEIGKL